MASGESLNGANPIFAAACTCESGTSTMPMRPSGDPHIDGYILPSDPHADESTLIPAPVSWRSIS